MKHFDVKELDKFEAHPGGKASFVHTDHMTMSYWNFDPGFELPEHSHPHEQVTNVIEGEFEMTVSGETVRCGPGSIIVIDANEPHSGRSITQCYVMDIFYPVREDFKEKYG